METFKILKILKNSSRDCLERSKKSWKSFSKNLPTYTKSFRSIVSLSQKTVSTLSLKNLQEDEKCQVLRFRTIDFDIKVASKPHSIKLHLTKFWFEQFLRLYLAFLENGFNFVSQKLAKIWKMPFSKVQNFCYSR